MAHQDMQSVIDNYKSDHLWTENYEKHVISILEDNNSVRDRQYYHIKKNFQLVNLAGVKKVSRVNNQKIMVTRKNALSIINDMHTACGHKGEKKTYKKVSEQYANIPISLIKTFIQRCEGCTRKARRITRTEPDFSYNNKLSYFQPIDCNIRNDINNIEKTIEKENPVHIKIENNSEEINNVYTDDMIQIEIHDVKSVTMSPATVAAYQNSNDHIKSEVNSLNVIECQVEKVEHFRHLLLFAFNQGLSATTAAANIRATYGEDCIGDSVARKWFSLFKQGCFDLNATSHSRRPAEIDIEKLNTLFHEDLTRTTEMMDESHMTINRQMSSIEMNRVPKDGLSYQHSNEMKSERDVNENEFKCTVCCRVFAQKEFLITHMSVHCNTNNFQCDACGKSYRNKKFLINHMMLHNDIYALECSLCDEAFRTEIALIEHLYTHTNFYNFK